MLMLDYKDVAWWYWLASSICLWFAVTIEPLAYNAALAIGVWQLLHFAIRDRSLSSFTVQIRLGYLSVLLSAMPEGFFWVLWIPAIGTVARVVFGYCIMARMLMLLPINRTQDLNWRFVLNAFLTRPVRGNILHGLPSAA
ncbi:MAG: hypothetical protein OEZ43_12635 [Gammaproteobacteria bacterium]|nr:hypothetical protein [Gammaproteobacteria bacterium]